LLTASFGTRVNATDGVLLLPCCVGTLRGILTPVPSRNLFLFVGPKELDGRFYNNRLTFDKIEKITRGSRVECVDLVYKPNPEITRLRIIFDKPKDASTFTRICKDNQVPVEYTTEPGPVKATADTKPTKRGVCRGQETKPVKPKRSVTSPVQPIAQQPLPEKGSPASAPKNGQKTSKRGVVPPVAQQPLQEKSTPDRTAKNSQKTPERGTESLHYQAMNVTEGFLPKASKGDRVSKDGCKVCGKRLRLWQRERKCTQCGEMVHKGCSDKVDKNRFCCHTCGSS